MSQLGQFQKLDKASTMSAFLPIAAELRTSLEARFVPNPDVALLQVRRFFGAPPTPSSKAQGPQPPIRGRANCTMVAKT